ncbi:MAG TPA: hypothetical protein VKV26_18870 [Dehalococcoidia bacterium]|nr:hypothetical protein [Dehalococcoidia bacterium]
MRRVGVVLLSGLLLAGAACGSHKTNNASSQPAGTPAEGEVAASPAAGSGPVQAGQAPPSSGAAQAAETAPAEASPGAGPIESAGLTVYGDNLASRWEDWSWSATVDLASTSPVYSGQRAISATITQAWGGVYLHTDIATDISPYTYLRFAAQVTQAGQRYAVSLVDTNDKFIANPYFLANLGDITVGSWKYYRVPLAELGGTAKPIKGIVFQDGLGKPQPALFLDDVGFQ